MEPLPLVRHLGIGPYAPCYLVSTRHHVHVTVSSPLTRYEQLGPRADCEESLRLAIGLRDLHRLSTYLALGVERGLTKRNSHIFYAATELNELLVAEGAAQARSSAVGLNDDVQSADAAAAAAGGTPPLPPRREKTEAVRLRLNDALSAFIEEVCCPDMIFCFCFLACYAYNAYYGSPYYRWTRASSTTLRCSCP